MIGDRYKHLLTGRVYEVVGYDEKWTGGGMVWLRNVETGAPGNCTLHWLLHGYHGNNRFERVAA